MKRVLDLIGMPVRYVRVGPVEQRAARPVEDIAACVKVFVDKTKGT